MRDMQDDRHFLVLVRADKVMLPRILGVMVAEGGCGVRVETIDEPVIDADEVILVGDNGVGNMLKGLVELVD